MPFQLTVSSVLYTPNVLNVIKLAVFPVLNQHLPLGLPRDLFLLLSSHNNTLDISSLCANSVL